MDYQDTNELIEKISDAVIARIRSKGLPDLQKEKKAGLNEDQLKRLAKMIDHTLLKAEATYEQLKQLCQEAAEFGFASVCVNAGNVILCKELLKGTEVPVCSVIGFPLGATTTKTKVFEAEEAIENGASEIDMVINIGALKSGDYERVKNDIEEVVIAARGKAVVKVIIETSLLTDQEKIRACELAKEAKADFVKTSTGFSTGGATAEDIRLMREVVGPAMGVKASGGIGDFSAAKAMLDAGACTLGKNELCRLGTSKSLKIMEGDNR